MSLEARISDLAAAIGADIKALGNDHKELHDLFLSLIAANRILPDPENLGNGTMLQVVNGKWVLL